MGISKIVFDPRYLLLTSKERKTVFDKYVRERADEERKEKKAKAKERKENFVELCKEVVLHLLPLLRLPRRKRRRRSLRRRTMTWASACSTRLTSFSLLNSSFILLSAV